MPILDPLKLDIIPCNCGRLSNKVHCIHCGSYDVRGSARQVDRVDKITGITTKYHIFRCRHCGQCFDGFDWQFDCRAPAFASKSMRFKQSLEAGDSTGITKALKEIGVKGVINKGRNFAPIIIEKAISPEGVKHTRMRLLKLNLQEYLDIYEEKFGQQDRDKGIAPPHELQHKINSESEEKE